MKQPTITRWFILPATWLAVGGLYAGADDGFDRYEVILSRMPFGEIVMEEAPAVEPAPAAESFAKAFRMCSITKPEGRDIRIGIVDGATKKSFMLSVGENNADGVMLVSANLEDGEAVLQKGGETALIKLEQTSAPKPAARQPSSPAQRQASTYQERRQERREERLERVRAAQEERERQAANQPRLTGEALRQHLQEYNMEAIRQGLPALPVELTPEQDAQLVAEGVLPSPDGAPPGGAGRPAPAAVNDLPAELRDVLMEELTEEELRILQNY